MRCNHLVQLSVGGLSAVAARCDNDGCAAFIDTALIHCFNQFIDIVVWGNMGMKIKNHRFSDSFLFHQQGIQRVSERIP